METKTFKDRLLQNGGRLIVELESDEMIFTTILYRGERVMINRILDGDQWKEYLFERGYKISDLPEEKLEMLRCEITSEPPPPPANLQIMEVPEEEIDVVAMAIEEAY